MFQHNQKAPLEEYLIEGKRSEADGLRNIAFAVTDTGSKRIIICGVALRSSDKGLPSGPV